MSKLARMLKARANAWAAQREEEIARSDLHEDLLDAGIHTAPDSFVPSGARHAPLLLDADLDSLRQQVTLIVYGWHNVQPGPLSWVFPSVRHAIGAAKAMRNAVCWAVVRGRLSTGVSAEALDEARASGMVVLEHAG
jgi:hypothetical protein